MDIQKFSGGETPGPPHTRGPRLTRPGAPPRLTRPRGEGAASNAARGKGEGKEGGREGGGRERGRENVSTPQHKFLVAPLA